MTVKTCVIGHITAQVTHEYSVVVITTCNIKLKNTYCNT